MDLDGFTRRYWLREVDEGHEFCGSLVLVRIIFLQETYFRKNRCRKKLFSRESCCRQDNFLARNQFSRGPCCCRIFSHQNPLVKRKYFSLKRTCFHEDYSVARIFSHENPVVLRILFCKKSVFTRIQLSLEPFLAGILLRGSCYRENLFFFSREKPVFTRILARTMAPSELVSPHELHGFTSGFPFQPQTCNLL